MMLEPLVLDYIYGVHEIFREEYGLVSFYRLTSLDLLWFDSAKQPEISSCLVCRATLFLLL